MYRAKKTIGKIITYIFLTIVSLISIFPFYWMIASATNASVDVTKGKLTLGSHFITNFNNLMATQNVGLIFYNTAKIAVIATLGTLLFSSLAAYGFHIYQSKVRDRIYGILLLSMMVPFAALMIPLFKIVVKLKLLNSHWGIILPSIVSVFLIFFFKQSFKAFPKDLVEAARIDGASEFKIFLKVVFPSMKSTYAAAAIYAFMGNWNSYIWPLLVLLTDDKKTLTLMISSLSSAYFPDFGMINVAIIIATIPIIIIFFSMQKHFVQGMLGSVKS